MKKIKFVITILILSSANLYAQTNVSGGIFTNTTWTQANSPYIVTDTVVVFPGVTLTIQPGVTVKFASNTELEVRQAQIIAIGNSTDSITFTSDSTLPHPGIWETIWINGGTLVSQFNYCNFYYADNAIFNHCSTHLSTAMSAKHSRFAYNFRGIYCNSNGGGFCSIDSCSFTNNTIGAQGSQYKINRCNISYNQYGLATEPLSSSYFFINNSTINSNHKGLTGYMSASTEVGACWFTLRNSSVDSNSVEGILVGEYLNHVDTISNCQIKNNPFGIKDTSGGKALLINNSTIENNDIGLKFIANFKTLICNRICNNTSYDLYYGVVSGGNLNMPNNYWCGSDSTMIETKIYDGYDNVNFGLVNFMPLDTFQCYLTIGVPANSIQDFSIDIFPNPFSEILNVKVGDKKQSEIILYNVLSQKIFQEKFRNSISINTEKLISGIYFYEVKNEDGAIRKGKLIKQ